MLVVSIPFFFADVFLGARNGLGLGLGLISVGELVQKSSPFSRSSQSIGIVKC